MHKLPKTLTLGCFASNRNPCESNALVREAKRLKTKEGSIDFTFKVFRGKKKIKFNTLEQIQLGKAIPTYKSSLVTSATNCGG